MDSEYTGKFLNTVGLAATPRREDPQTVLHAVYDAIIRGDFTAFGDMLAEDVAMQITGFGPMDGAWSGRDNVVAATRKNFSLVASQKPEVESMICEGNCAAVLLRETGVFKPKGEIYSVRAVQWFTIAGGKISRIDQIVASKGQE